MLCGFLAALRERSKLSKPEIMAALGVSRPTVDSWENPGAGNRAPSPAHFQALLDLYDASPEERLRAWELRASASTSGEQPGEAA